MSTARANPSSSLEAVTQVACCLTSSVALPIAIEVPLMFAQHLIGTVFMATGLVTVAPLTLVLVTVVIQLIGTAAQLGVLVTAFPYFLRETV